MKRALQYKLPGLSWKTRSTHGGSDSKGNPREARPVDTKQFMHVVLRSTQARGPRSFLAHLQRVEAALNRQAALFGVTLHQSSTPGNHLHMLLSVRRRKDLGRFLRSLSGVLARILLDAEKGRAALRDGESFWDARPWSRIVAFGRDFRGVKNYVSQNTVEALGISRGTARGMVARIRNFERSLLKSGGLEIPGFG